MQQIERVQNFEPTITVKNSFLNNIQIVTIDQLQKGVVVENPKEHEILDMDKIIRNRALKEVQEDIKEEVIEQNEQEESK